MNGLGYAAILIPSLAAVVAWQRWQADQAEWHLRDEIPDAPPDEISAPRPDDR